MNALLLSYVQMLFKFSMQNLLIVFFFLYFVFHFFSFVVLFIWFTLNIYIFFFLKDHFSFL